MLIKWIVVLLIFLSAAIAEDWPAWRGLNGDGFSKETGILKSWPAKGIKELWRIPLGNGYSSISIVDNIAYTAFSDSKYDYCIAVDAKTGKIKWKKIIGHLFKSGIGSGPRATPAIDLGKVYIVSGHGELWCLDAKDGKKIWHINMIKKFASIEHGWGLCSSAYIYQEMLFYHIGGKVGIIALNKNTGKLIWKSTKMKPSYSTPTVANICGEQQAIFFTFTATVGLEPKTGKLLWRYAWPSSNIAATPICHGDYVFASSPTNNIGGLVFKVVKKDNSYSVEKTWKHNRMRNHYASSLLYKGYIYGFHNSILKCIDFKTGKKKWTKRAFSKGLLVGVDGHAIILGQHGDVGLVKLSPKKYMERGRTYPFFKANCLSVPAISNGRLFVRDQRELVCLDLMGK